MAGFADCLARLARAAGRDLTEEEIHAIFTRIHKAALDVRAGRIEGAKVTAGKKLKGLAGEETDLLIQQATQEAIAQLEREAALRERQANLQVIKLGGRQADVDRMQATGLPPLEAVDRTIARD